MKILIAFTTNYGSTATAAEMLKVQLKADAEIVDLRESD